MQIECKTNASVVQCVVHWRQPAGHLHLRWVSHTTTTLYPFRDDILRQESRRWLCNQQVPEIVIVQLFVGPSIPFPTIPAPQVIHVLATINYLLNNNNNRILIPRRFVLVNTFICNIIRGHGNSTLLEPDFVVWLLLNRRREIVQSFLCIYIILKKFCIRFQTIQD